MTNKSFPVEKIKKSVKLSQVVGRYADLVRASGGEYKCRCLFHDDKDPSMYMNDEKGLFHCFSCGAKGDVITIIEHMEGIDFRSAVERLAKDNDIDMSTITESISHTSDLTNLIKDLKDIESEEIFEEDYLEKYRETQHRYLIDLGFKKETLEEFEIGYCYDQNDTMYDRVTIPWRNSSGDLVAIAGRDVGGKSSNKYKSCFGSKKENHLYNLNRAKDYADNGLILVEDEKSVMRLWEWGYRNAVALGGAELGSKKWLLRKYTDTVYVCMDNCESGICIQKRIIPELYAIMNVYNVDLPEGYKDVAEISDKGIWEECWEGRNKIRR